MAGIDFIPNHTFDAIIIGGSYSGLSAALALGRSLRRVLIIDGGLPCNRQTPHSHNFITHDGKTPADIVTKAKSDVLKYKSVSFLEDFAVSGVKIDYGFSIRTESGKDFTGKKLIFASGINDIMPDIKGFSACWGISVIHCPYCHGYEFKGKSTAIFANAARAFHLATMVSNLTDNLSVITSGEADFTKEQKAILTKLNIPVYESQILEITHQDGAVRRIVFADSSSMNLDALYASLPFTQHCEIPATLGCEFTEHGYIKVNQTQETTIDGVYACGDNSNMMRSLANAVYAGNLTGAMVNAKLVEESL